MNNLEKEIFPKFKTEIDKFDLKNEQVIIRKKNLTEIILEKDFIETIFYTLLGKNPTSSEKRLLNSSLVSIHTGYEAYPPTLLFPRIATSTGAPIAQAIVSGYASSGEFHLGAIKKSMKYYLKISKQIKKNYYKETRKIVSKNIKKHKKIFGFGHPVLKKDPRPETLRKIVQSENYSSKYIKIYDGIKDELYSQKKINPNVDGINGSILLSLGFSPSHAEGLFLFSRTIGMIAHIVEEKNNQKPWAAWRSLVGREMIENLGK